MRKALFSSRTPYLAVSCLFVVLSSAAQAQPPLVAAKSAAEQPQSADCKSAIVTAIKWVPANQYHIKQLPFTRPVWERRAVSTNCK